MELLDLEAGLRVTATAGHVLNCQEIVGIQAALTVLKRREKYEAIYFWGKIFGQKADYYLAYGLRDSEFEIPIKSFFYSGENFEFHELPQVLEEDVDAIVEQSQDKFGQDRPFVGVPTEPLKQAAGGEEEGAAEPPEGAKAFTEVDRLAKVVLEIDFDTAAVPRGSFCLNSAHQVVASRDFKGLGASEATSLGSWLHFRCPTTVACRRALAQSDSHFFANFLDPLDGDLPKGCWAIRQDPSATSVTLRSLNWPGYVGYHVTQTLKFGGAYFGYAMKCHDLAFIN